MGVDMCVCVGGRGGGGAKGPGKTVGMLICMRIVVMWPGSTCIRVGFCMDTRILGVVCKVSVTATLPLQMMMW